MKTFFTSDLHFGHNNILKFDNRPFNNILEHDDELIRRWNNKVSKGDVVYVLGDLFWKPTEKHTAEDILKKLNGQIILIKGNHDNWVKGVHKKLLAGVKDYDDIKVQLEDGTIKRCVLSHYFTPMYNGHYYGGIHLHGHSHVTEEAVEEFRIAEELNKNGIPNEIYNVGCMYWNYEPVTLDEIIKGGKQNV